MYLETRKEGTIMKHSRYERAVNFLHQIASFISDWNNYFSITEGIKHFNSSKSRKVQYASGMTRYCMITSDYVIKWDKTSEKDEYWTRKFGGVHSEIAFYEIACNDNREYLFAEAQGYNFNGIEFEIMPRVSYLGMDKGVEACDAFDEDDWDYITSHVFDVHDENFGYLHGSPVVIDYASTYMARC